MANTDNHGDGVPHPVLVGGAWRASRGGEVFNATNPATQRALGDRYPVSGWEDLDDALAAADAAAAAMRAVPGDRIAAFLDRYAAGLEARAEALVAAARDETALPVSPRLRDVELPRTTNQLRQAASAARGGTWRRPTIDTKANIRSCYAPIGPVLVIGPNNFPFAFNAVSGGDFAAAIAAGNPTIAKAHPLHPTTSRLLAEAAHAAAREAGLPEGAVQMIYHMPAQLGLRMVADARLKAVAFTGSRTGGLKLKAAADAAGTLFFGEMSSINPVVILPGALSQRGEEIATELVTSVLMGTGQFCTNPGLILLLRGAETDAFAEQARAKMSAAPAGVLFSESGQKGLLSAIVALRDAGAELLTGGAPASGGEDAPSPWSVSNTLMRVSAGRFLEAPAVFQAECFGNASLLVIADGVEQAVRVVESLEGNLTGTIYSATGGAEESAYEAIAASLRPRVGRLLNDKMPTGVAVSSAMQHGGPFPATSQPHFTAVGMPAAIARFTQLESYDNVRPERLPACLRDANPAGMWRMIDGEWRRE